MVFYGSGQLGDVAYTSNTTESAKILQYGNLTVNSGVTLTVPNKCTILVDGTMTVEGVIEPEPRAGSGGDGGDGDAGVGGDAGGKLNVIAREITGSGTIRADGQDGGDATFTDFGYGAGSAGLVWNVPSTDSTFLEGTNGSGGGDGGNEKLNGGAGGSPGDGLFVQDSFTTYLEEYIIPNGYVTGIASRQIESAGGGGGSAGNYGDFSNGQSGGGGGGGAGGSFGAPGGAGGNGGDGQDGSNDTNQNDGGTAGGGGGAGGEMVIFAGVIGTNITLSVRGGDGGDGTAGNDNRGTGILSGGGGGGGGGSGGVIVLFADQTPQFNVSGGTFGIGGGKSDANTNEPGDDGNAGSDGFSLQLGTSAIDV